MSRLDSQRWTIEIALLVAGLLVYALFRLVRRFGKPILRRAFGAVLLGMLMGVAGTYLYAGLLFTDSLWKNTPRWMLAGLPLGPLTIGGFVMSRYSAPRFIRGTFLAGMALFALTQSVMIFTRP